MPDTDSARAESWRGRGSLTRRILAVNLVALALLAGSLFYLDNFRVRLIEERRAQAEGEAQIVAAAIAAAPKKAREALLVTLGKRSGSRLRVYDDDGDLMLDSWAEGEPAFSFNKRLDEPWDTEAARMIDRIVERTVGAQLPPWFIDRGEEGKKWPELMTVLAGTTVASRARLAPDRTLMISAATPVNAERTMFVLSVSNARDVTRLIRAERYRLAIIIAVTLMVSILLSLFLARTIVTPLRRLALAAQRVRLGRARDVVVPRLPQRADEIGALARAVSDMTQALRERIDATEAFAADIAHELKNPLASMASAVESLDKTADPEITTQLRAIIADDVRRLDRLITEISELSRLDAQLTRARFEAVDMAALLGRAIETRAQRRLSDSPRVRLESVAPGRFIVLADEPRLTRAIDNIIDNALSFSPPDGTVTIGVESGEGDVRIAIDDEGPGVPREQRDAIFRRFHSDRADIEFARHSGLGLAIARTIVEGHNGRIGVEDRPGGAIGARFVIALPLEKAMRR